MINCANFDESRLQVAKWDFRKLTSHTFYGPIGIAILYRQKECNKQKSGSRSLKYYLLLLGAIISGEAIAVGAILIFTLMLRLLAA